MRSTIKHFICILLLFFLIILNPQPVQAKNTQDVTGTCEYDKAYEVLKLVNKERKSRGLNELTMDKDLLEAAMLRAAEITVSFSHTRPNGEKCFSASEKMYGENIAYGYGTSDYVMEAWMNSPGHKSNILSNDYRSIGIGVFYKGEVRYWVQCFGFSNGDEISKPSNIKRTYRVALTTGQETKIVEANPLDKKVENFKVTAGKKKLALKWKKKSGIDGYQIQISTNKKYSKSRPTHWERARPRKPLQNIMERSLSLTRSIM